MSIKMKKIASFEVDHARLEPGLYVSRYDKLGNETITTFDLRFVKPNSGKEMATAGIHTLEHLFATLMRNHEFYGSQIVYVGPMGCRTGLYVVVAGKWRAKDMMDWILECLDQIIQWGDDVPGTTEVECGNAKDHSLPLAHTYALEYRGQLQRYGRTEYSK